MSVISLSMAVTHHKWQYHLWLFIPTSRHKPAYGAIDVVAGGVAVGHRAQQRGGRGVDVVLAAIGGTVGEQVLEAAADGAGRVGVYGFASGQWTPLNAQQIARRGLSVIGPLGIVFAKSVAEQRADTEQAMAAANTGQLVPRIHATCPLERAGEAHAELEARRNIGAILLTL